MRRLALLAALCATTSFSQDLTHPLDMNLPETGYTRPDPGDYRLALENGLIAYVAVADQVPLVTMSAFVRAGKVSDAKQGAAESLADALRTSGPSGTGGGEFLATLERMTADYTVELHDEWMEITLNVPVGDLDAALGLFAGLLRSPLIGAANIDNAARGTAPQAGAPTGESGPVLYEGSMSRAVERFHEILYADHPYGRRPTKREFGELKPQDVASFHARHFVPGNVTLAVAGAIDVDDIGSRLDALFGDWPAAPVPGAGNMPPVELSGAALHRVPSRKLQSWLVIGHDLPPVPVADEAAFDVMNYIIGAVHLNTRLMRETRYKFGYTNDASGFPEPRWNGPGSYTFRSYSRPEVIGNIYRNMMREVVRIREEPVSDHELFVAKGALADGSFPVRYVDGYALTRSFALERLRYGNHDRSASYAERVRAVTKADVLAAARKYIRPGRLQVVLVGEEAFELE